jgi:CubicO group peptidase (beta-lactamase class C family)
MTDRPRRVPSNSLLSSLIQRRMSEMAIPGTIVLLRTPEQTWAEAFGTRQFGIGDPITTDDHFRIGSNTKTMTGTALLAAGRRPVKRPRRSRRLQSRDEGLSLGGRRHR